MKRMLLAAVWTLCVLAMVTTASAQENLNFADLPLIKMPSPLPNGYGQLDWGNVYYVNPTGWSGAGPGYELGPQNQDVAFVGGKLCRRYGREECFATLTDLRGFQLVSASVAAGYGPTLVTVTAYNNDRFLGSQQYVLTTQMRTLNFPASWDIATQVVFLVSGQGGNLVIYSLSAYTLGG